MSTSLKSRLSRGEQVVVFAVGRLFHPNTIQMYALHGGFAGFWIDDEHVGFTTEQLVAATLSGRACGFDSFVRIAPSNYAIVTRCLEAGAGGVMAAQIESAAHAEEFMQWAKFAPRGRRGLNTGGYDGQFGLTPAARFCEEANRDSFVAIQIETASALAEVDAIAAIDGVDLLFVGPSDLSQALGVTGDFMHPKCLAALDEVAAACRRHGKSWGAVTTTPQHAAALVERGCQLISPTNDVRTMNAGIKSVKQTFAPLFADK